MLFALSALTIAFAALLTLRTWLKPAPVQEKTPSLPRMVLNAAITFVVLLVIFSGPRWAAISAAAVVGLYTALHFGRFFLAYTDGRSALAQAGIFTLLSIQAAGFLYAFVAIALTLPHQSAT